MCLHGLGARADRWRTTLPSLAEHGFNAFAVDFPGHGFAGKGAHIPATVPALAAFVADVCRAMGWSELHLVGTSLGGHVAAHVALDHPRLCKSLVLVGSLGLVPIGAAAGANIRANVRETSREKIAAKMNFVFAQPGLVDDQMLEEEYRINNSPGAAESFRVLGDYIADAVDTHVVGPRLAAMRERLPMLLVWGALDRAVPLAVGREARALLPGVELVEIANAGHAPYAEQPTDFQQALLPFLRAHR
nr:alpha/beta fold hydrolase [Ramlibacter aurantiacus]